MAAALVLLGVRGVGQEKLVLEDGWQMQSEGKVADGGPALSVAGYPAMGWYNVSVPTTIIAGLLANKVYDFDPFYGMNF